MGNTIQSRRNESGLLGLSGELRLSEEPLTGNWRITVDTNLQVHL